MVGKPGPRSIPSSRALDALKDIVKSAAAALGCRRAFAWLGAKYYWTTVFVNYRAIRCPVLGRMLGGSIWPQALYIEGTNICNAACMFCPYPRMRRPKAVMPMELFESVARQYAEAGGTEVDLTPIVGDPLADRHLFERLDLLASLPGIRRFHFFTNAILLDAGRRLRLLAYGPRLTVHVSIGGFDPETYRRVMGVDKFEAASAAIRGLVEEKRASGSGMGVQIDVRAPKGAEAGGLWDFIKRAEGEGLLTVDSVDAFDSWAGMIDEEALAAAGFKPRPMPDKRGPCHRLLTSPTVLVDGRVNACACRDVEGRLIIGDARTQPLAAILGSGAVRELIFRHEAGDWPDVCRKCTYYDSVYPWWLRRL